MTPPPYSHRKFHNHHLRHPDLGHWLVWSVFVLGGITDKKKKNEIT